MEEDEKDVEKELKWRDPATFWHTKTHINCCTLTTMQTTNLSIVVMQSCRAVNDENFVASATALLAVEIIHYVWNGMEWNDTSNIDILHLYAQGKREREGERACLYTF